MTESAIRVHVGLDHYQYTILLLFLFLNNFCCTDPLFYFIWSCLSIIHVWFIIVEESDQINRLSYCCFIRFYLLFEIDSLLLQP